MSPMPLAVSCFLLSVRYPVSVIRFRWPLVFGNLLRIDNCELIFAEPYIGARL